MKRETPLLFVAAALATGCTAALQPPLSVPWTPSPAFTCSGNPRPPPPREIDSAAPMGRLEVRLLSGPPSRDLEKVRLRVVAENVPLGVFAGALSDALGVGVIVSAPLVNVRIGLAVPDIDFPSLSRVLSRAQSVYTELYEGAIHFEPEPRNRSRSWNVDTPLPEYEGGLFETRLFRMPDSLPPDHFASFFCAALASPRGRAIVVGKHVVLQDYKGPLDRADQALSEGALEPSSPPPAAARSPENQVETTRK